MPQNRAAFIVSPRKTPLDIRDAPYPSVGEKEVIIRNRAVAINHIDWKIQDYEFVPFRYPGVLGHEGAGEVVEVGTNCIQIRVGDRVLAEGTSIGLQKDAYGSFQLYTAVPEYLVSPIPDSMSFEQAAVVPLGIATSIMGFYANDTLELKYPSFDPEPTGQVLAVWGGASACGSHAIQLAYHAGYEVIATASKHNFDYVRKLGASSVLDYNQASIVEDLVAALKGKTLVGAFDAVAVPASTAALARAVMQSQGKH